VFNASCTNNLCTRIHTQGPKAQLNYNINPVNPNPKPKPKPKPKPLPNNTNPLKPPKPLVFNISEKLDPLMAAMGFGKHINYLSLRIYNVVTFRFQNGKFDPSDKTGLAKATILYKENNSKKPVSFYGDYNKECEQKLKCIMDKMDENTYRHTHRNAKPYALIFKGHISQCYTTFDEMFYACFEAGNLRLDKKKYDDPNEAYQLSSIINSQSFKGIYLWEHTVVELKSLYKDKNPNSEATDVSSCVICLDGEAEYAVIPCGHRCLCSDTQCRSVQNCPMCRVPVKEKIKIFS